MFTESLTVRILGDSSQLKSELDSVAENLRGLQAAVGDVSTLGDRIGRGFGRLSGSLRPLEQASQWLSRLSTQVQSLGRMAVTLNVEPALQSLERVSASVAQLAAQLMALSALPVGIGGGGPAPGAPIRRLAQGGLVLGPSGNDAVPALLSAGEFVLSRSATEALGVNLLHALNSAPTSRPTVITHDGGSRVHNTTNHFGGVTIEVREAGGVNDVVRDLRMHGAILRNRRG